MKTFKAWRSKSSCGSVLWECGDGKAPGSKGLRIKTIPSLGILTVLMLFLIAMTMKEQYEQTKAEGRWQPFDSAKASNLSAFNHRKYLSEKLQEKWRIPDQLNIDNKKGIESLPRGIIQETSDLELKPLWRNSRIKDTGKQHRNLMAMTIGIKQKANVNLIVKKFLSENFTVILFHYDGNLDGWNDLEWSRKAIHIGAQNQTKWWFAKRFLHPAVVSMYDYIFIWDEDLGVENFHPGRWVEGMAPVFTRAAWQCAWHLIQNDLIHGWGMDMKLGYCAQGDHTKNVGVIDSEYIVHQGLQSLGGPSVNKSSVAVSPAQRSVTKAPSEVDPRSEIRRQSVSELITFRRRWQRAVEEDKNWVDPFEYLRRQRSHLYKKPTLQHRRPK